MKIKIVKINYRIICILIILTLIFFTFYFYKCVYAQPDNSIKVPIIMYHSILKDSSKCGKYVITPSLFEEDLKYITQKGYTTITMNELISYVYYDTPLPKKPIIITFDDGYYNNLTYAVPLLEKYKCKAVISIVGKYTDTYTDSDEANTNYSYLRWKDVENLIQKGTIEFQNHTYNMHSTSSRKGCMKKVTESLSSYEEALTEDILKLQQEFFFYTGYIPTTFTYPYGSISKASIEIIKKLGFKSSLSCNAGVNYITKDANCLYLLKRNNRPANTSPENFFKDLL